MARKKCFVVIGMGSFGTAVAKTLIEKKCIVNIVDKNEQKVNNFLAKFPGTDSIITDTTITKYIIDYGIHSFDSVILCVSTDLEAAILTAVSLKEAGVERIIAKASDEKHAKILKQLGIDNVILRDELAGTVTAVRAMFGINSNIQLVDNNYVTLEIEINNTNLDGRSLSELGLLNKADFNIIHIARKGKIHLPSTDVQLAIGDRIFIVAKIQAVNNLQSYFASSEYEDVDVILR